MSRKEELSAEHLILPPPPWSPLQVDGRIVQQPPTAADKAATRPRPKRVRGASGGDKAAAGSLDSPAADEADEAAQPGEEEQPAQDLAAPSTIGPQQPPVKRRRHEQEHRQEL